MQWAVTVRLCEQRLRLRIIYSVQISFVLHCHRGLSFVMLVLGGGGGDTSNTPGVLVWANTR